MRAEDYLQFQFDFWCDLFWNRKKLLEHLLVDYGTGYEWIDGELIYVGGGCGSYDEREDRYVLKEPVVRAEPSSIGVSLYNQNVSYAKHMISVSERFEKMYYDYTHYFTRLSKEYSPIYHVPDDIKPDWLELCYEVVEYIKEEGIDVSDINLPKKK